jgi:hypothetical protein
VLPLLDPTLIDGDRVFIATVVANVLDAVERCNGLRDPCGPQRRHAEELDRSVNELHAGLLAASDDTWQALTRHGAGGAGFSDQLLRLAKGGIHLADRFEAFAHAAAEALGVHMLVQPLDDVDMAGKEAWTALEAVRRYLTGPSLLPVVAGHLPQFVSVIFGQRLTEARAELKALKEMGDGRYKERVREVEEVSVQHVNKLFDPSRRQPLRANRERLLREAWLDHRQGGHPPIPLWGGAGQVAGEVPQGSCFLGDVERLLFGRNDRIVSGIGADLLPDSLRELLQTLRVLDGLLTEYDSLSAAQRRSEVEKIIDLHWSATAAAGQFSTDELKRLMAGGVWAAIGPKLSTAWGGFNAYRDVAFGTRPEVGERLLDLCLTEYQRGDLGRALQLLCAVAPVCEAVTPSHVESALKGSILLQESANFILSRRLTLSQSYGELPMKRYRGLPAVANWPTGVRSQLHAIARYGATARNDLVGYWSWPSRAELPSMLTFGALVERADSDTIGVLRLFAISLAAEGVQQVWISPLAGINAAHLFCERLGFLLGNATARPSGINSEVMEVGQGLLNAVLGRAQHPIDLVVPANRHGQLSPPDESIQLEGCADFGPHFAQAMTEWAFSWTGRSVLSIPSAGQLLGWCASWRAAVQRLLGEAVDGFVTVGGYLERSMLALIATGIGVEFGPTWRFRDGRRSEQGPPELLDALLNLPLTSDGDSFYRSESATLPAATGLERVPHGPLARFIEMASSDGGLDYNWAGSTLPLTSFFATCPLVRAVIGPAWCNHLSKLFPLRSPAGGEGTGVERDPAVATVASKEAYGLLSGLPLYWPGGPNDAELTDDEKRSLAALPLNEAERRAFGLPARDGQQGGANPNA